MALPATTVGAAWAAPETVAAAIVVDPATTVEVIDASCVVTAAGRTTMVIAPLRAFEVSVLNAGGPQSPPRSAERHRASTAPITSALWVVAKKSV